jgi:heme exporter protein C
MKSPIKTGIIVVCALGAIAGFGVLPFLVMGAPLEQQLYFNQKIFYYHVPAAAMMFLAVFVCGGASLGYLIKRKRAWDDVAWAAGDLVVVFGAIVLTTGPIWAKAAWGTWWVWEARLTSSLLLWMIFIGYALVRRYGGPGSERLAAGLAFFGVIDVPLIYFAVNFWRTQHPTNNVVSTLPPDMRSVLNVAFLSYLCLFVLLMAMHLSVKRSERRLNEAEDTAADLGME